MFLYKIILCLAAIALSQCAEISKRDAKRLKRYKVVPEVIEKIPSGRVTVKYGMLSLKMGNKLKPTQVHEMPTKVSWPAKDGDYYTLIMQDPDPPAGGKVKEVKHWLVVNIPGKDVSKGDTIFKYIGPATPKGSYHRYTFLVYKQPGKLEESEYADLKDEKGGLMKTRTSVLLKDLVMLLQLGELHAVNFMRVKYDKNVPKYMKELQEKYTTQSKSNTEQRDADPGETKTKLTEEDKKKLREYKVVPDVLKKVPDEYVTVEYGDLKVDMGNELTPTQVHLKPTKISWPVEEGAYYTLILHDPDIPARKGTTHLQHWLVVNIPGNDIEKGETLYVYFEPAPPKGNFHRYTFIVYRQDGKLEESKFSHIRDGRGGSIPTRSKILPKDVVKDLGLEYVSATNFFRGQYDDNVPKYSEELHAKYD